MNPHQMHALADLRRAEIGRAVTSVQAGRAHHRSLGHRVGILLVEAGFHLIARAEPRGQAIGPRLSWPLAR